MKTRNYFLILLFSLVNTFTYGQKPTEVPKPSEKPIDLSNPADLIIYIVLPLCVIAFFVVWKLKRNKRK